MKHSTPFSSVQCSASAMCSLSKQLAALLGRESVCQIRKTDTVPPRISVIDVVEAITGQVKSNAGKTLERVKESHPEVYPNWINFRFPGRGQRETPIADVRGIVEIVMLLPGRHATRVRRQGLVPRSSDNPDQPKQSLSINLFVCLLVCRYS